MPDPDRFLITGLLELGRLRMRAWLEHPNLFARRARARVRLPKTPKRVQVVVATTAEAIPDETPHTFDLTGIFVVERNGRLMVRVHPWSWFRRGPLRRKRLPSRSTCLRRTRTPRRPRGGVGDGCGAGPPRAFRWIDRLRPAAKGERAFPPPLEV